MKSALERRILLFALLVITLTIAVNTGFNIEGFRLDYRDGIILRCQTLAAGLKSSIEKVLGLGIPLGEMEGVSIRCQEVVANDPEIVYCLIEDPSGNPLYANDPSFNFTRDVEFIKTISDTTTILQLPRIGRFYDVSLPLFASGKELAGRVRIGFPETVLEARTKKMLQRSIVVLGLAFVLVFGVVVLFTKRDLVGPIQRLIHVAKDIAGGNFRVQVPALSTRDFNELGLALQEMAHSLTERDEKIQEGYQELEETNIQLQKSYEFQERISAELGRSREMYRSLLEDASDAIVVSDGDDRIVLLNKAAETFFGLSRESVERSNLFSVVNFFPEEALEALYHLHHQVLQGEFTEAEIRFQRPVDNQKVIGWVRGSPVFDKDGRRMVQAIIRDVTQEREVKANLEKSARELERLNQMKDSFLGVASHELKTPLTVIIGYSELILGDMAGQVDDNVLSMVKHIAEAAERLSSIVRDMVDVTMIDSKRMPLRYQAVDVNDLIGKAANELEFFFLLRKQNLELVLGKDLPVVHCDPARMIQAISNLVVNAIKFTPDGGTISIETRDFSSLRPPNGFGLQSDGTKKIGAKLHPYVEIIVRDTGIGIGETDQIHIFEKFYEVGNVEEHFSGKVAFKSKGTGLGLTIVKGVIDMHGGEVWVQSPGCDANKCPGTEFHIMLSPSPVKRTEARIRA